MESRLRAAYALVLLLFLALGLRLVQLQVIQGARYQRLAEQNHIRRLITPAPRGKILDRNGELLADSRPSFSILLVPAETDSAGVQVMADLLETTPEEIWARLSSSESGLTPVRVARDADLELVARVEENSAQIRGVVIKTEPRRYYPYGEQFCHALGYVNEVTESALAKDTSYRQGNSIGVAGLEAKYEQLMRSHDGAKYVIVNAWGKEIGTLPEQVEVQPQSGQELHLTLDAGLQKLAFKLMQPYAKGAIIGMSLRDGGVLCLLSRPGFDPNLLSGILGPDTWQTLLDDKATPFVNRVTMSIYNPGSCLKPLTALAGMHLGAFDEHTLFQSCTGVFDYGRRKFKCTGRHGRLALVPAIAKSCNIYFYQAGLKIGVDALAAAMTDYWLGAPTGIDLPAERGGIVPSRTWLDKRYGEGKWSSGIVLNLAIGQGEVQMTPLQLAVFYSMLAGNGDCYMPHLLDYARDLEGRVDRFAPVRRHADINAGDMRLIREALVDVVQGGTGGAAAVPGVTIGGKTGTAEHTGGDDHAWFVCYAGRPNPEVVFCVLVENAGKGGMIAAPIARELIRQYFGIKEETAAPDSILITDEQAPPAKPESAGIRASSKGKFRKR